MDEKKFKTKYVSSSKDVLDFYDEYAQSWDQRFNESESTIQFHKIRLDSFLDLAQLKKNMTIIELGIGTGPYVNTIAPLVKQLVCIDGSSDMLKMLKRKIKNINNVQIKLFDLAKPLMNFDIKADLIYFFGLIEHIIEVDTFLDNCKKMLHKDGKIIVITPNALCPWYYGIRNFFRSGKHCTSDKYYSRRNLKRIMLNHEFIEERCIYWGFFPAGISDFLYKILNYIGKFIEKTPLKVFSGGISLKYRINSEPRNYED